MKPRATRFAVALLACSVLSGGAWADQASEALVRGWIDNLDKSPEWKAAAASITSQGAATVIAGLAIGREDGSVSLAGEELRFDDLASGANGLSASAITAKNLGVTGKPWAFMIPKVEATGFASPAFDGWVYDPKTPATSLAKLYTVLAKTRLDLLSMPEASFNQEIEVTGGAPLKSTARYADVRYEGLANGKLKLQSIGKLESHSPMASGVPTMTFTIEGMSARNTDLAAFARVVDPDAYAGGKGDGKWVPAVEGGTYGKVTVLADGKPVTTIADISFGEMAVRQTNKPFVAALDELILKSPNQNEDEVLALLQEHLSNFVGWFKLSSVTMSDLKADFLDGGKLSLAKASIADVSPDGMKRFALEDFNAEGTGGKFGLKLFELADVYMELGKFSSDQSKGQPLDTARAGKIAGSVFELFPKIGKIAIEGVTLSGLGPEALSLESFLQTGTYDGGAIAADTKTELKNLVIPSAVLRATPEAAQIFDALGYDRLAIAGSGVQTYDKALGAFSDQSRIAVENAGALALYLAFGGLTPERIKAVMIPVVSARTGADPDPQAMIAAADGITFNGFSLRFEDASLTKRLVTFAAKMQNMDEQTTIANATAMLQLGLSQAQSPDFAQKTVAALGAFLKEPKSLTLALKPPAPVGVQQMLQLDPNNPAKAIELFGVSVTAND
jgi:hypothetical protein